jgi:phosphoribosylformylglycinamidine synthase
VTPTLLITAIGVIPDIRKTVSLDLKSPGNLVYVVGQTFAELGGSEYYKLRGFMGNSVPKVRGHQAKQIMQAMIEAIDSGCIRACHDISEGGLAVATAEMAFTSNYGVELELKKVPRVHNVNRNDFVLFSESNSRFLVEVQESQADKFESITNGIPYAVVGKVTSKRRLSVYGLEDEKVIDSDLDELLGTWKRGLEVEA